MSPRYHFRNKKSPLVGPCLVTRFVCLVGPYYFQFGDNRQRPIMILLFLFKVAHGIRNALHCELRNLIRVECSHHLSSCLLLPRWRKVFHWCQTIYNAKSKTLLFIVSGWHKQQINRRFVKGYIYHPIFCKRRGSIR